MINYYNQPTIERSKYNKVGLVKQNQQKAIKKHTTTGPWAIQGGSIRSTHTQGLHHHILHHPLFLYTNTVFTRASLSGRDRSNSKRIGIGSVVGALFTRATAKTNRGQYDRSNVGVR